MRRGYAIRDRAGRQWLKTRTRVEGVAVPVTVWVQDEAEAMIFRRLKDARQMLKVVREHHRQPSAVQVLSPGWKVVAG